MLKIEYVYQSTEQLRKATPLTLQTPPQRVTLALKGCPIDKDGFCARSDFEKTMKASCNAQPLSRMRGEAPLSRLTRRRAGLNAIYFAGSLLQAVSGLTSSACLLIMDTAVAYFYPPYRIFHAGRLSGQWRAAILRWRSIVTRVFPRRALRCRIIWRARCRSAARSIWPGVFWRGNCWRRSVLPISPRRAAKIARRSGRRASPGR